LRPLATDHGGAPPEPNPAVDPMTGPPTTGTTSARAEQVAAAWADHLDPNQRGHGRQIR
jgi:hypothetical protein